MADSLMTSYDNVAALFAAEPPLMRQIMFYHQIKGLDQTVIA
jgi:hypothetical protein